MIMHRTYLFQFISNLTWLLLASTYMLYKSYPTSSVFWFFVLLPAAAGVVSFLTVLFIRRHRLNDQGSIEKVRETLLVSNPLHVIVYTIDIFVWLVPFVFFSYLMYGIMNHYSLDKLSSVAFLLGLLAGNSLGDYYRWSRYKKLHTTA